LALAQQKRLKDRLGRGFEQARAPRVEVAVAQREASVEPACAAARGRNEFCQPLRGDFGEQRHAARGAVIALHELLHGAVAPAVVVAEGRGQLFLMVEQQLVLPAAGLKMQRKADPRQELPRRAQFPEFFRRNQPVLQQRFQRRPPETPKRDPVDRVQAPEPARPVLDIRFQVGGRVAVLAPPFSLFAHLGAEELAGRPYAAGIDRLVQLPEQAFGTGHEARFHQRGHDRDVGARPVARFRHGAGAMAQHQPRIPEKGQEFAHLGARAFRVPLRQQHQHIHIRSRIHFRAAVSAHRQQRRAPQRRPGMQPPSFAQQFVQQARAQPQQFLRAFFSPLEAAPQLLLVCLDAGAPSA